MKKIGRAKRLSVAAVAATAATFGVLFAGGAAAVITPTTNALDLANALSAQPGLVTGASFDAVPPSGTPNGTQNAPLSGFPRHGSTFSILTNGDVNLADDPNTAPNSSGIDGGGNVRGDSDEDVTILKIQLNVPNGVNCLGFDFKFLSEEFPESVGQAYNDAFIAELDTSDWSVSGSTITAPHNFASGPGGQVISVSSTGAAALTSGFAAGTTYDGATRVISARSPVTPGAHALYLSIFDLGDPFYDSAVFIDNLVARRVANPQTNCQSGITGGSISGTVYRNSATAGNELPNAWVQLCTSGNYCRSVTTDSAGVYSFTGLTDGTYVARVFPPSAFYEPEVRAGMTISGGTALAGQDLVLTSAVAPQPPNANPIAPTRGTCCGGVPVIHWQAPTTLTIKGCANGTASYLITFEDGSSISGPMTETPVGSGNYVASIPPVYPHHGRARVVVSISCQGPIQFTLYIDPSGIVYDTHNVPIAGATVTLFYSDTGADGSFTTVPNGDTIMSPSNRTNPDSTDAAGHYGWDVIAGFYFVRTEKQGCSNPADHTKAYVDSAVVEIPPEVTDLDLVLDCDHPTAVQLRSFSARRAPNGSLVLRWRTGSEVDVLGFNLYRQRGSTRTRLNRTLIAARGGRAGTTYSRRLGRTAPSGVYWLQAVRVSGMRSWLGPATR